MKQVQERMRALFAAFVAGMLAGFWVSVPPGPVTATALARTTEGGWRTAIPFVYGAALCEIFYAGTAFFGTELLITGRILEILNAGCFVLALMLGIRYSFFNSIPAPRSEMPSTSLRSFLLGLTMPLTTPTIGASYIVITAFLHANAFLAEGTLASLSFSVGTGIGALLWLILIVRIVERLRERVGAGLMQSMTRVAGVFLLLTAAYVGQKYLFL